MVFGRRRILITIWLLGCRSRCRSPRPTKSRPYRCFAESGSLYRAHRYLGSWIAPPRPTIRSRGPSSIVPSNPRVAVALVAGRSCRHCPLGCSDSRFVALWVWQAVQRASPAYQFPFLTTPNAVAFLASETPTDSSAVPWQTVQLQQWLPGPPA